MVLALLCLVQLIMLVVIDLGLAVVGVLVYGLLRNQYMSLDRLLDDECMEVLREKD